MTSLKKRMHSNKMMIVFRQSNETDLNEAKPNGGMGEQSEDKWTESNSRLAEIFVALIIIITSPTITRMKP